MADQPHVHKLRRHKYPNGSKVYFCTLDCSFKIDRALALGKRTICNICGDEFIMNEYSLKLAKPHCTNCGKMKIIIDGETKFVSKGRPQTAIVDLAKNTISSLQERLGKVVIIEKDEDI